MWSVCGVCVECVGVVSVYDVCVEYLWSGWSVCTVCACVWSICVCGGGLGGGVAQFFMQDVLGTDHRDTFSLLVK